MATEELIVLLDAQTQKLDAKLKATEKRLDDFEGATKKADSSLEGLTKTAKKFGNQALDFAKGAIAVNSAISAMVLFSAKGRKNLELLSKQAKTSTEDFQALAFATKQYGVDAEQIADISKDISDKVSEFSIAGTGAFQDYADSIKLTKDEARAASIEFATMSSQEVIGKMISEMEKADLSASDMTFALESMGNDLSKLQPLFADNSKELVILKTRFDDVNSSLQITEVQGEKLKEVSTSFDLMTTQIGNAATAISATLAPVMDDFFNDVISVVPDATQTIIDFANSFLDAENISSIAGVNTQIQESQARIADSQEKINSLKAASNSFSKDGGEFNTRAQRQLEESIESERIRTGELNDQLVVLNEQNKALADAKELKGGEIGGETGAGVGGGSGIGTGDEIQAIADRFKEEEDLLIEKFNREIELIGENNELKLELEQELYDNLLAIDQKYEDDKEGANKDGAEAKLNLDGKRQKTEQSMERSNVRSLMAITSSLIGHNDTVGKALFVASQALAASEVFFNTQVASARALAELGPIAGPPVALGIQTSGQLSIAAIAATTLGSLSASGSSGGGGGGAVGGGSQSQQQDFQEETSSLELTDSSASGSQTFSLSVPDGDEIGQAIANWLSKAQDEGRV